MQIEKNEIAKILTAHKILTLKNEDIEELTATIILDSKGSYIIIANSYCKIQFEIKVQNVISSMKFVVKYTELLELAKKFTKKATIDIKIDSSKMSFKGMQAKEEVKAILHMIDGKVSSKTNTNTSVVDASDILVSLATASKIIRDIPQIATESLIELEETHHKLSIRMNSDIELFAADYITDNESRSLSIFCNKEELKILNETIKLLKSLDVNIGLFQNGITIAANGIEVFIKVKNKGTSLPIKNILDKIEQESIFMPLKLAGIEIDNTLQKDDLFIYKVEDGVKITNKTPKKFNVSYSYRMNKILSNKNSDEIEIIEIDRKKALLKIAFNGAKYYLLPKKNKV